MILTALITVVLVALGLLHWRLSRLPSPWWGALVPALWVAACVAFLVAGELDSALRVGAVAMVAVALARVWAEGRATRDRAGTRVR